MVTRKKTWIYNPPKTTKAKVKVPEKMKQYLKKMGDEIVEKIFKPEYLKPVPEKQTTNHIVDIYTTYFPHKKFSSFRYLLQP